MSKPEHDPSVRAEPHLRGLPPDPDPTERKAARTLARERGSGDAAGQLAEHSVFDEPALFPNREPVLIEKDWYCGRCGYNLRGLMTGHACPECGVVERYEPPRAGELTYARWQAESRGRASPGKSWAAAAVVPLLGAPFALLPALVTVERGTVWMFVVLGPVMAEALKVAIAGIVIERRRFLIRRAGQLYMMTLGTAVVFAAVQNILSLKLYYPNSSAQLFAWRWTACVVLHCVCTLIATRGVARAWMRAQRAQRCADPARASSAIAAAILFHAVYNACVYLQGYYGYGF